MNTTELLTALVFIIILIAAIAIFYVHTLSEDKIKSAIQKQREEDQRILSKYKLTTYEQEKQKNELLKKEYETLRLIKENDELQEKINKMKFGNGNNTVTDSNNDNFNTTDIHSAR